MPRDQIQNQISSEMIGGFASDPKFPADAATALWLELHKTKFGEVVFTAEEPYPGMELDEATERLYAALTNYLAIRIVQDQARIVELRVKEGEKSPKA